MKTAQDVLKIIRRKFEIHIRDWFMASLHNEEFLPIEIPLCPKETDFNGKLTKLQDWIKSIRQLEPHARIIVQTVRWRATGGTLSIPQRVIFDSFNACIEIPEFKDFRHQWRCAKSAITGVDNNYRDAFYSTLTANWEFLSSTTPAEVKRLYDVTLWLLAHPSPNCFIRETPIEGIDTKWLERHLKLVCGVLSQIKGISITTKTFYHLWSFKKSEPMVRTRHADQFLCDLPRNLTIALPASAFKNARPRALFMFENEQTGLAVTAPDDVLIFFGLGQDIHWLTQIEFMHKTPIFYMGDLDYHGLSILNNLRRLFPQTKSRLMTKETFLKYKHLAVIDPTTDAKTNDTSALSQEEWELFQMLTSQTLRLEQERIPIDVINAAFAFEK